MASRYLNNAIVRFIICTYYIFFKPAKFTLENNGERGLSTEVRSSWFNHITSRDRLENLQSLVNTNPYPRICMDIMLNSLFHHSDGPLEQFQLSKGSFINDVRF